MKKWNSYLIVFVLCVSFCLFAGIKDQQTAIMICDFTGTETDLVYTVRLQINYATAFELPPGKEIKHVVIGDPINWRAKVDDDGKVCFVRPVEQGIRTSLSIVTTDGMILVFNLIEISGDFEKQIIAKVKIIIHDDEFFITRTRDLTGNTKNLSRGSGSEKKEEDILQFIRKKSKKYKVRDNQFFIENVCDDGVFTYLYVPKAQYRPAVYFQKDKKAEKEPIKYIDKGDYYVVHKVLVDRKNRFMLKLGKTETVIQIQGD